MSLLGSNDAFHNSGVFHQNVKAHLEDVVHLEFVAEALFLLICIDVTEGLATR